MKHITIILLLSPTLIFAEPLFYFHTSSSWSYQVTKDNSKSVITNKVLELRTIDGQNWYKLSEYGEIFWVNNKEYGQVEAVNFYEKDPSPNSKAEEVIVFKYPAKIGETWENYGSPTTYLGIKTVKVPAGEFECHMYNIDMENNNYSKTCIAKNIGPVYNEAALYNEPVEISELINYKK